MLIGRLPATSVSEAEALVSKIITYEITPVVGDWNKNVLFFSDNNDDYNSFAELTDSLIVNYLSDDFHLTNIDLNNYDDPATAKQDVLDAINRGCLIANYFGRGGIEFLAKERMLANTDVATLTNGIKQPFFVMLSCLNGFFHHAQTPECLAETLVKSNSNGARACFSPSGFAIPGVLSSMAEKLYDTAFQMNVSELGTLTFQSRLGGIGAGAPFYDHIEFFNLFGDPASHLRMGANAISVNLQIKVDYRIVGVDFFDGDPLMNTSDVLINIAAPGVIIDPSCIQLTLNKRPVSSTQFVLTPSNDDPAYQYQIKFPLQTLRAGKYSLQIVVINPLSQVQRTTKQFQFTLYSTLALDQVLNYPNPTPGSTTFTYFVISNTIVNVSLKIYTIAGRLINQINGLPGAIGYNQYRWDGLDGDLDELANGVYFYKLIAKSGSESNEVVQRLIIMR
ncbi:T9SS type A sorting domain-containing protein [candidate division KSB1 bacterium]|nr:T9SS type A sorting domain-containing protein [candidate division KSB1 bacterium]